MSCVSVLKLFLAVLWVGLQCVIVVFPYHTHLFVANSNAEMHPSRSQKVNLFPKNFIHSTSGAL